MSIEMNKNLVRVRQDLAQVFAGAPDSASLLRGALNLLLWETMVRVMNQAPLAEVTEEGNIYEDWVATWDIGDEFNKMQQAIHEGVFG